MIRIVAAFAAAGLASAAAAQMAPEPAPEPAPAMHTAPMAAAAPAALPHCSATMRDSCVQDERFASHSSMPGMHDNNAMHYKTSKMMRTRRR